MTASVRRIVLVGLPGSGKSTIGPLLAARLGWVFLDFDEEIVRRSGLSVARLFQEKGETAFRAMEAELTAELSSRTNVVLAPGGGWVAQPGLLESLSQDSAVVWLRVTPAEAIRRLGGSPVERPLLTGADPLGAIEALQQQRQHRYARADLTLDVDDRDAAEIVDSISAWLRRSISS
jgi:shikimate kinase